MFASDKNSLVIPTLFVTKLRSYGHFYYGFFACFTKIRYMKHQDLRDIIIDRYIVFVLHNDSSILCNKFDCENMVKNFIVMVVTKKYLYILVTIID